MELNIGLEVGRDGEKIPAVIVKNILGVLNDATETRVEGNTLVARLPEEDEKAIFSLAELLAQDCIAVLYSDGTGSLVGPRASEWGEFNLAFFTRF